MKAWVSARRALMTQFGTAATGASASREISVSPAGEMVGTRAFVTTRSVMKVKYLNKAILDKVNRRAIANNYTRAIKQEFIDSLPDDINFPITFCMLHEHAAGQPVPAHMRCRIMTGASLVGPFNDVYVDVEMGMFDLLPEHEVKMPKRKKESVEFSDN
jgi:hypothetical protein